MWHTVGCHVAIVARRTQIDQFAQPTGGVALRRVARRVVQRHHLVEQIGAIGVAITTRDARFVLARAVHTTSDVQTRVGRERAAIVDALAAQRIGCRHTRTVNTQRHLTRAFGWLRTLCIGKTARGIGNDHTLVVGARTLRAIWHRRNDGCAIGGVLAAAFGHGRVNTIRLHALGDKARTTIVAQRQILWRAATGAAVVDRVDTRAVDTSVNGAFVVVIRTHARHVDTLASLTHVVGARVLVVAVDFLHQTSAVLARAHQTRIAGHATIAVQRATTDDGHKFALVVRQVARALDTLSVENGAL